MKNCMQWDGIMDSFEYLKEIVNRHKAAFPNRKVWSQINENPLKTESIDRLVKKGLKVIMHNFGSVYSGKSNLIKIENRVKGYRRDAEFFHELCHAWYGKELDDYCYNEQSPFRIYLSMCNNIIAYWIARQLRADPGMLRHAVLSFGLEPQIYDMASYLAFSENPADLNRQETFPFAEEHYQTLRITKM